MRPLICFSLLFALLLPGCSQQQKKHPYQDSRLSPAQRAEDLLSRMTLEEKVAQLRCITKDIEATDTLYGQEGIGGIGPIMRSLAEPAAAAKANRIHRLIRNTTRLGIPPILHDESLHGLLGNDATIFPQAIALASTWDTSLVTRVAHAIGKEVRARGIRQVLAPVINIARDVRWGRTEETYGEDTYLTSRMGVAYCSAIESEGVLTTPKHFAANLGDGGRDSYPIHFNERLLREIYLPAFKACIQEGGASSVMAAYNALDGLPCSANPWLLTRVLKNEWGFRGFVVSDYGSLSGIANKHFVAATDTEGAALGLNAGLDVELPDIYVYGPPLLRALNEGKADKAALDNAVRRVLEAKFRLGLFDDPFVAVDSLHPVSATPDHRNLALEAAREGIVLLKNESKTLPLKKSLRSIAVIGPAADSALFGGYSGWGRQNVSVLKGIRDRAGQATAVRYAPGCALGYNSLAPIPPENLRPSGGKPGEHGLRGEYFANQNLQGQPTLVRIDPKVYFTWGMGSPDKKIPDDHFSVRWTGTLVPTVTGTYRIGASTDDGMRLTLDGKLIIDSWYDRGATLDYVTVKLEAGTSYNLQLEYYESIGWSFASLGWELQMKQDPRIASAAALARQSDAAIVVATLSEGEGYDRSSLDLPGRQEELIQAVAATGTPTTVVLIGGSAVTMQHWKENVGAILTAWYPGEQGGRAVAEILFGDVNPAGRIPITFPLSVGQVPLYYNHKPTGRGDSYVDISGKPLFPFGFGLSYTTFEYSKPIVPDTNVQLGKTLTVSVTVRNTGEARGDEVVQLYLHRPFSSVTQPVQQLRGFRRITLEPGAERRVEFSLTPDDFSLFDRDLRWVEEPGKVEIQLGSSSADIRHKLTVHILSPR
jgi:beta-glucosidase